MLTVLVIDCWRFGLRAPIQFHTMILIIKQWIGNKKNQYGFIFPCSTNLSLVLLKNGQLASLLGTRVNVFSRTCISLSRMTWSTGSYILLGEKVLDTSYHVCGYAFKGYAADAYSCFTGWHRFPYVYDTHYVFGTLVSLGVS